MIKLAKEVKEKINQLKSMVPENYVFCWHFASLTDYDLRLTVWRKEDNGTIDTDTEAMEFVIHGQNLELLSYGFYTESEVKKVINILQQD